MHNQVHQSNISTQSELAEEVSALIEERILELEKTDPNASAHRYHIKRYVASLSFLPDIEADVIDLGGALGLFSDVLKEFRHYRLSGGDVSSYSKVPQFDFEKNRFPYADSQFDIVLFMEVLEHLREDPMHAVSEMNRILKIGGKLLLTTPNIASWKSIRRALAHENPALFPPYLRYGGTDRHNREYTFNEVIQLLTDGGFSPIRAEAIDIYDHLPAAQPIPGFDKKNRGDTVYCLAEKISDVQSRKPNWLYWPAE